VTQRFPEAAFAIENVHPYNPPLSPAQRWSCALQFMLRLGIALLFLWQADELALGMAVAGRSAGTRNHVAAGLSLSLNQHRRIRRDGA